MLVVRMTFLYGLRGSRRSCRWITGSGRAVVSPIFSFFGGCLGFDVS